MRYLDAEIWPEHLVTLTPGGFHDPKLTEKGKYNMLDTDNTGRSYQIFTSSQFRHGAHPWYKRAVGGGLVTAGDS